MSNLDFLGFRPAGRRHDDDSRTEHVLIRRVLHRVLEFTGRSIDDVVNDPLVKNEIYGYYKLHRHVERVSEAVDLEKQWNPLKLRL